jgi:glycosyltransferase involved in cell wall biosynthesis
MRVLQLNIDHSGTGADRCARELYEDLPKLSIETSMWIRNRSPETPPAVRGIQFRWEEYLAPLEAFPDFTDWRHRGSIGALRSISSKEFDLVHIHNVHSGWMSIRAVRELTERFPCVWTLHDEWAPKRGLTYDLTGKMSPADVKRLSHGPIRYIPYHRYHDNYKWRRTGNFLDRYMPQPKVVICPSEYMAGLARSSGVFPRSEIVHIPNGTRMLEMREATMDRAEAKVALGLSPDRPALLMISADLTQAHKGIGMGVAAIKEAGTHRDLQVVLLGSSAEPIEQLIRPIRAVCLQARDDATLARAYRAADITLIPSLGENLPYVALESLACGTPLISFAIGGMPEIIGQNERGILCRSIDALEMARHLEFLLSRPEIRSTMACRGVKWVRDNCGMPDYLQEIAAVYQRVLANLSLGRSTLGHELS